MGTTLVSWLGRTDLRAVTESDHVGLGPVAQALQTGRFSRLELLCDYAEDQAAPYLVWLQGTESGKPIGVEITAPGAISITDLNRVLASLDFPALADEDVARPRAA